MTPREIPPSTLRTFSFRAMFRRACSAGCLAALLGPAHPVPTAAGADDVSLSEGRQRNVVRPDPAPVLVEHPLIEAVKANPSWERSREFTDVLNQVAVPLDTIRDPSGRTALHWALIRGADDYAALLLQRGASPNLPDGEGRSPLHHAVERRSTWSVYLLILRGADGNAADAAGQTPLGLAVRSGDFTLAEILLWAGADPARAGGSDDPEIRELLAAYSAQPAPASHITGLPAFVRNPIHQAARRGDFPLLERLLAEGPGANVRDEQARTPLHEAITAGRAEVVFYLLMMGADPNALDAKGRSPLGYTMGWLGGGLDAMRRFLLAKGANPHAVRGDGHSELSWSVMRDNEHGLHWLIWMRCDPRQRTSQGTPFEIAVREGHQRIIDLLRRHGIDGPDRLSNEPAWLLENGAKRGNAAFIDEALAAGIPVDHPAGNGDSALMLAIGKRNVSTARHLVGKGAGIDFRNEKSGWTPLLATIVWDYPEMTAFRQELLEAGADPNVANAKGVTPLMRSVWHHPTTPLKQLIEYGADLNARDPQGRTALGRAIDDGKTETADFLRLQGATE